VTATVENLHLCVNGDVERPLVLSYQEPLDLNQVLITIDIHCVTGWTLWIRAGVAFVRKQSWIWSGRAAPGAHFKFKSLLTFKL